MRARRWRLRVRVVCIWQHNGRIGENAVLFYLDMHMIGDAAWVAGTEVLRPTNRFTRAHERAELDGRADIEDTRRACFVRATKLNVLVTRIAAIGETNALNDAADRRAHYFPRFRDVVGSAVPPCAAAARSAEGAGAVTVLASNLVTRWVDEVENRGGGGLEFVSGFDGCVF